MQSVSSALDYADEKGLLDNIVVFRYFGLILIVNKKEMIRYAMQSRTSGGKEGMNAMKKLTKKKMSNDKIKDLTQGLQDFIKRLQEENPDAEIFIID